MANYKYYNNDQSVLIPLNYNDQFIPGTFLFAINHLIENMIDCSGFDELYRNDGAGCSAYDPKVILKIILYAYSLGINSSRRIEQLCQKHVDFMALTGGQHPKKSTIAAFVSSIGSQIDPLFERVLLICAEEGLLGGTTFALDGVKLSSNASKVWSGTFGELRSKRDKIRQKLKQLRQGHLAHDKNDEGSHSDEEKRARSIQRLTHQEQKLTRFFKESSPKKGRKRKELKSNVTDNESAKMTTSHGTIQGYNANALVDEEKQVVIYSEAFGNGQDYDHVEPMIDGAKRTMTALGHDESFFEGKVLTADTSYHSPENLEKCREEKVDAYIPDNNFRQRDPRFVNKQPKNTRKHTRYTIDDFDYDPQSDTFRCPNQKELSCIAQNVHRGGKLYKIYSTKEEDCVACPFRRNCLKHPKVKRRRLSKYIRRDNSSLSNQMIDKIDTDRGRQIYGLRFAIAEPVFGNICSNKGLDRFTLRTKAKVNIQWKLYCLVHNLEKLVNYGRLYLKDVAYA